MLHLSDQVNATTIDGVTPLFNACSAGSATCTEVLLENGAKPQSEICQPSPIHEASSKGTVAGLPSQDMCVIQIAVHFTVRF